MTTLVEWMRRDFLPRLSPGEQSAITSQLDCEGDVDWALDCMMQAALLEGAEIPAEMIDEAERLVDSGDVDPNLEARIRGRITQLRRRAPVA